MKLLAQAAVIIKDQVFNDEAIRKDKVYGIDWVQRMRGGFRQRDRTHLSVEQHLKE